MPGRLERSDTQYTSPPEQADANVQTMIRCLKDHAMIAPHRAVIQTLVLSMIVNATHG